MLTAPSSSAHASDFALSRRDDSPRSHPRTASAIASSKQ
jgi:hypothetical protein